MVQPDSLPDVSQNEKFIHKHKNWEENIDKDKQEFNDIKKEIIGLKKDQNKFYTNIIEILSIFVVVISFIFSSIKISTETPFGVVESTIFLFAAFVFSGILITIIHLLIRKVN